MNRRKLFGFLAATPFAAAAVREVVTTVKAEQPETPVGFMRVVYESRPTLKHAVFDPGHQHMVDWSVLPSHTHSFTMPRAGLVTVEEAVPVQEIFDGKQFVRLNSREGAAVFNKLMLG